ncbi:hypothetical protein SBOR_0895 [Sclerotinia borealis F-4128]|uniref:Pyroglutamyl peptidase type I n=1 Tax=Sclerotinia borealis (strain F-4128) TaxID=1432307 RepID=W9CPA0_SCLBF|nr:hypothetical protein SBOR_0895 [Sclerotinia borealis F-4128]
MGSISENNPPQEEEIRVLVTGFGPFRAQYPINPSWEIASRLPRYVPTDVQDEGHHPHVRPPIVKPTPRIRIDTYEAPIHVGYEAVRELIPKLLDEYTAGSEPDYILHIGMASGRSFYSCERRGHRSGYSMRDVDQKLLNDEYSRVEEGDNWIWHDCPEELLTTLPFDKMFRQWKEACPVRIDSSTYFMDTTPRSSISTRPSLSTDIQEVDTRISEDAGNYLCDFIYYTSLAHRYKQQQPNKAMFLHVPLETDHDSIQKGVKITTELIRAMVECDLKAKDAAGNSIDVTKDRVGL